MQLKPRYGDAPIITLDGSPSEILVPAIRQRRRLTTALGSFDDEQWTHPSRCEGWSSRDVVVHLDHTNSFWTESIKAGLRGEPTQFLATFDPVTSPAQLVAASSVVSTREVLDQFSASTESLAAVLTSLADDDWSVLAEAPPGHLSISAVVHHALWDSWVHERDILCPLGMAPVEEADEVAACLRYAAALGPAFGSQNGNLDSGLLAIAVTDPELSFVVEASDRVVVRDGTADTEDGLSGDAVELLEALSLRKPFDRPIPVGAGRMLSGLLELFEFEQD